MLHLCLPTRWNVIEIINSALKLLWFYHFTHSNTKVTSSGGLCERFLQQMPPFMIHRPLGITASKPFAAFPDGHDLWRSLERPELLPLLSHGRVSAPRFSLSDRGTPDPPPYPWAGLSSSFPEASEEIKGRRKSKGGQGHTRISSNPENSRYNIFLSILT